MNLPDYPYPGDENARSDVESGIYGRHYEIKEGDVVLDVGAHVGFFYEWVRARNKKGLIICVEPHPRNVFELNKRVGGDQHCIVLDVAARNIFAKYDFLKNNVQNSGGHSFYTADKPPYCFSIEVPVINIGRSCLEGEIYPAFVKIDTEGSELEILTTLFENSLRPIALAIECHGKELFDSCKALLEHHRYSTNQEGSILFGNQI